MIMPHSQQHILAGVGVVAIGRNEGGRFLACLASLPHGIPAVYVDSGSTDNSVANAEEAGVHVVHLSTDQGFTAARARNAGWRALLAQHPDLRFIQFLDGDCTLDREWLPHALAEIEREEKTAVVFGRLKERFPERSIYNAMCDREWDIDVGEVRACGGNAFIRADALIQTQGYNDHLIAGEEPDLCLRMRFLGWSIIRIPGEMGLHDASILKFSSWWKRAKRTGYAYAEHVFIHRRQADPAWKRSLVSMLFWSFFLPTLFAVGLVFAAGHHRLWAAISIFIGLLFIAQFCRLCVHGRSKGLSIKEALGEAILLLICKFAHSAGAAKFLAGHFRGRKSVLIEYK